MSQRNASISPDSINQLEAALESKIEQFASIFEQKLEEIQTNSAQTAETVGVSLQDVMNKTGSGLAKLAEAMSGSMLSANETGSQLINVLNGVNGAINLVNEAQSIATSLSIGDYFGAAASAVDLLNQGMNLLSIVMQGQGESWDESQIRIMNTKASWDELRQTQAGVIEGDLLQIDHTRNLWDELQNLVDANGNVNESDRERVNFIAEEVNKVIPDAIQLNEDETVSINGTTDAIDRQIEKKRAQLILDGLNVEYKEALSNARDLEKEQIQKSNELYEDATKIAEMYTEMEKAQSIQDNLTYSNLLTQAKGLEIMLQEKAEAYDENEKVLDQYYQSINDYDSMSAAILSDNFDKINEINMGYGESFKTARTATEEELAQQVRDTDTKYNQMKERYERHSAGITKEMVDKAYENKRKAEEEYAKIGKATIDGAINGTESNRGRLTSTWDKLLDQVINGNKKKLGISSPSKLIARVLGAPMAQGLAYGFDQEARNTFDKMTSTVLSETSRFTATAKANAGLKYGMWPGMTSDSQFGLIPASGKIKTVLNIDGREFAVATANYMSEELAWRNL